MTSTIETPTQTTTAPEIEVQPSAPAPRRPRRGRIAAWTLGAVAVAGVATLAVAVLGDSGNSTPSGSVFTENAQLHTGEVPAAVSVDTDAPVFTENAQLHSVAPAGIDRSEVFTEHAQLNSVGNPAPAGIDRSGAFTESAQLHAGE
jgi:hypothetical protein